MDLGTALIVVGVLLMIAMHARGHGHGHAHGAAGGAHAGCGHGGHGHAGGHAPDKPDAETTGTRPDVEKTDAAPRKHDHARA